MKKYSCILKFINFIKEKCKIIYYRFYYKKIKKDINIKMFSIEETIEVIIKEKVSVSRFGDGEFKWLLEKKQNSFQSNSKELVERLKAEGKNAVIGPKAPWRDRNNGQPIKNQFENEVGVYIVKEKEDKELGKDGDEQIK